MGGGRGCSSTAMWNPLVSTRTGKEGWAGLESRRPRDVFAFPLLLPRGGHQVFEKEGR